VVNIEGKYGLTILEVLDLLQHQMHEYIDSGMEIEKEEMDVKG